MVNHSMKRLLINMYHVNNALKKRQQSYQRLVNVILNRFQSQTSKPDKEHESFPKDEPPIKDKCYDSEDQMYKTGDQDLRDSKWKSELAWLTRTIEPAMQLYRWALPTGTEAGNKSIPSSRSLAEIISSIQWSKTGFEGWSLSDLTVGLYLIYLRQSSLNPFGDVMGVQVLSEIKVQDFVYHIELAKGSYKDSFASLARNTMLRESNILKFVKNSSVMRPGYYIGTDHRKKLVILVIRGTHTVYDLITDIVSSSDEEVTLEGFSTHFGTAEAARWFLNHEIKTLRKCLNKYKGYRLRLVGHSLGGATASLLAIMLRKKTSEELGFDPNIVSAVGFATPPCVSKEIAEDCSEFVTTVVMQDDIIPRLSAASLARLRNEILETDWMSLVENEEWKKVIDLLSNAKQVVFTVQDVARKLADYAQFGNKRVPPANLIEKKSSQEATIAEAASNGLHESVAVPELFVPGTVYYLRRDIEGCTDTSTSTSSSARQKEIFTLWKRKPGEHFQRILLSSNLVSDHRCDSHYYALRDVIKGLPVSTD